MSFSLNEVEATARKATRGAGRAWGVADEAGLAARVLCAAGGDGVMALATCLKATDGACPITLGLQLADRPAQMTCEPIFDVNAPLLLLPFLGYAAGERWLAVDWGEGRALVSAAGIVIDPPSHCAFASKVALSWAAPPQTSVSRVSRARPDPASWQELLALAHRTYAPATEKSRLAGAGAGLSDND